MIEVDTYTAEICMAGDLATAKLASREFTYEVGECVTVEPTWFCYKGGAEDGVRVRFINYPRIPSDPEEINARAMALSRLLLERLCQHSYTIVATYKTWFFSRRVEAA